MLFQKFTAEKAVVPVDAARTIPLILQKRRFFFRIPVITSNTAATIAITTAGTAQFFMNSSIIA